MHDICFSEDSVIVLVNNNCLAKQQQQNVCIGKNEKQHKKGKTGKKTQLNKSNCRQNKFTKNRNKFVSKLYLGLIPMNEARCTNLLKICYKSPNAILIHWYISQHFAC